MGRVGWPREGSETERTPDPRERMGETAWERMERLEREISYFIATK